MRNARQFVLLTIVLLGTAAHARYYSGREGVWLSPDRAGMIDGPNLYQYVRGQPTMHRDPTGMFADIDPELPQFGEVFMASTLILADISFWKLTSTPSCGVGAGSPSWPEIAQALQVAILTDISILGTGSAWRSRYQQSPSALPAFTEGRTIYLTPAAGHRSIVSGGAIVWEPPSTPTSGGMRQIRTWVGRLGHELAHTAGFYGYGPGFSAQQGNVNEDLANRVGLLLEDRMESRNFLQLDPTPYNAGPPPDL